MKTKYYLYLILLLSLLGLADSWYLTLEHYGKIFVPCTTGILADCGKVLRSKYSEVFGIPLALIGVFHYGLFSIVNLYNIINKDWRIKLLAIVLSSIGTLFSLIFVYLQLFVIGSICLYCMVSALISFTLLYFTYRFFENERKFLFVKLLGFVY